MPRFGFDRGGTTATGGVSTSPPAAAAPPPPSSFNFGAGLGIGASAAASSLTPSTFGGGGGGASTRGGGGGGGGGFAIGSSTGGSRQRLVGGFGGGTAIGGGSDEDEDEDVRSSPFPPASSSSSAAYSSYSSYSSSSKTRRKTSSTFSSPPSYYATTATTPAAAAAYTAAGAAGAASPRSPREEPIATATSVRLSCLDPDGRCIHSLNVRDSTIETSRLPLQRPGDWEEEEQDADDDDDDDFLPPKIRTLLPENVRAALRIDPPLELFCTLGTTSTRRRQWKKKKKTKQAVEERRRQRELTSVCLYTSKAAFVLRLAYDPKSARGSGPAHDDDAAYVPGFVVSVAEPFERFLLDSNWSAEIVRIRCGPSRHRNGRAAAAIICPPNCLAMLTENTQTHKYNLTLYHGQRGVDADDESPRRDGGRRVTTPLEFATEEIADPSARVVDFCFAESTELSAFSSLSVLFAKGTGDVLVASPVVFDGTLVPRSAFDEGMDYLQYQIDSLDRSTARWTQCRAAQQYLKDIFRSSAGRFDVKANVLDETGERGESAADWPVQIQGPVFYVTDDSGTLPSCVAIENFGNEKMVGVALGKNKGQVDFVLISPSALVPRFAYESVNHAYDLDDAIFGLSNIVARVALLQPRDDDDDRLRAPGYARSLALVPDPANDTLLHYVTEKCVATISTNAVRVASRHAMDHHRHHPPGHRQPIRTTAWLCVSTSSRMPFQGAVATAVEGSNYGEDQLIVRLADGSMIPLNVTERQFLHEIDSFVPQDQQQQEHQPLALPPSTSYSNVDQALQELESTRPLSEVIAPLKEKISAGLAGMSKIVGTRTPYRDIEPDALAVAISVQERCNIEVVEPLLELKRVVRKRRQKLQEMLQNQKQQVKDLQETMRQLKGSTDNICEQMETAHKNSQLLSEKSDRALQTIRGLLPTITKAECDFIRDMKRLDNKCKSLEDAAAALKASAAATASVPPAEDRAARIANALDADQIPRVNAMLEATGLNISQTEKKVKETERELSGLALEPFSP